MKKTLSVLLTILCVSALLATTLMIGSFVSAAAIVPAVVERNAGSPYGTVAVKNGVLTITPTGENWAHTYTKNLNATAFGAADDVDITIDYKLSAHTWIELSHICVGGDGGDKQWGSVVLRVEGNGNGTADLVALTDGLAVIKKAADVIVPGNWYTFHITVEKATGTLSVYLNKRGEAAATTPVLTVTDAEHAAVGGAANKISTLSGGVRVSASSQVSQFDNVKIMAGSDALVDDDFNPAGALQDKVPAVVKGITAGTVAVKDGVLSITPTGGWGHTWTQNLNETSFAAGEDVEFTIDYKITAHTWADLAIITIGGDGANQWGGVSLRVQGNGDAQPDLEVVTELLADNMVKKAEKVFTIGVWHTIRVTVDKATGTMSVYVDRKGAAASTTPVLTVTDAEHAAAGGAANMISNLSGGVNVSAQFNEMQFDNVKLVADDTILLNDDFEPEMAPVTSKGAQIRGAKDGKIALRFGFELTATGIGYEDATHANGNYRRAIAEGSDIVDFGTILSLNGEKELTAEEVDGNAVVKVPALNLFEVAEGKVTYTAVVTNVPDTDAGKETPIYARAYVARLVDGETVYTYGEIVSRSVNDVPQ